MPQKPGGRLAAAIQASMLAATGMNDRGGETGPILRAAADLYARRPGGSRVCDRRLQMRLGLADPAWREVLANAIARGILQYIAQTN